MRKGDKSVAGRAISSGGGTPPLEASREGGGAEDNPICGPFGERWSETRDGNRYGDAMQAQSSQDQDSCSAAPDGCPQTGEFTNTFPNTDDDVDRTANGTSCRSKHKCFFLLLCLLFVYVQVIKMLLLVIALFLICWGPRLIFNIVVKLELQSHGPTTYTIRVASYLLSFIHSALNPFVYGLMSSTFRNIVFKSCAGRNRSNGAESCGASGRVVIGGSISKLASGTWAGDEVVDDDGVDVRVAGGRRRLLDLPSSTSPTQDMRMSNLCRQSRGCDPRERSFSQATVLTVAPMDVS